MKLLNLGCGDRFHSDWTNIDFVSRDPQVIAYDLRKGIPFPDGTFDLAYHSHLLEHFGCEEGEALLRECLRVLAPGGIIRVAVPDLEQIVREYVSALEALQRGEKERELDYDWMRLELYDQTVRERSGGEMKHFLRGKVANREFVLQRLGAEARKLMDGSPVSGGSLPSAKSPFRFLRKLRESFLRVALGPEYESLRLGRFRGSGEIHRCMYDEYSLQRTLVRGGFREVTRRGAAESFLPDWPRWNLDTEATGEVYKPDSLFMEARRP
jgi:predicted SAM-dependent methyltransferase